jgi:Protein of unknown function (DUF3089)
MLVYCPLSTKKHTREVFVSSGYTSRSRLLLAAFVVGAFAVAGAAGAGASGAPPAPAPVPQTDAAGTVWLCRPGLANNPCGGDLDSTTVTATNARSVHHAAATGRPRFDCFYLYPTASNEPTINSDLTVQPAETTNATSQAARFSQICDVWAPMYRQITVHALMGGQATSANWAVAYASVLSAWNDFVANDDNGRPIILIGHSQGTVMLIKLIQNEIDDNPTLRQRLVLAILPGGNVTVPDGQQVGATFQHVPLCTRAVQAGCVIAYSSFPSEPPANSNFGRPGQGISLNSLQTATTGVHVACVNPASISGGTAELSPYYTLAAVPPLKAQSLPAPTVTTPWVDYPQMDSATCMSEGGATWLQVTHLESSDVRPTTPTFLGPTWGYHLVDINLALGNLVFDAALAEWGYVLARA